MVSINNRKLRSVFNKLHVDIQKDIALALKQQAEYINEHREDGDLKQKVKQAIQDTLHQSYEKHFRSLSDVIPKDEKKKLFEHFDQIINLVQDHKIKKDLERLKSVYDNSINKLDVSVTDETVDNLISNSLKHKEKAEKALSYTVLSAIGFATMIAISLTCIIGGAIVLAHGGPIFLLFGSLVPAPFASAMLFATTQFMGNQLSTERQFDVEMLKIVDSIIKHAEEAKIEQDLGVIDMTKEQESVRQATSNDEDISLSINRIAAYSNERLEESARNANDPEIAEGFSAACHALVKAVNDLNQILQLVDAQDPSKETGIMR